LQRQRFLERLFAKTKTASKEGILEKVGKTDVAVQTF